MQDGDIVRAISRLRRRSIPNGGLGLSSTRHLFRLHSSAIAPDKQVWWHRLERRTISITPGLHKKVLNLRAIMMSRGVDLDYTTALNFLADLGYDELSRSGFKEDMLLELDKEGILDGETKRALGHGWAEGKLLSTSTGPTEDGEKRREPAYKPPAARSVLARLKHVRAHCVKCAATRQIKDPQIFTLKSGRNAVRGKCYVCGSAMVSFRIPH